MKQAVIVDCVRTPIGRAHKEKGVFRDVRSDDLAVAVVKALVERTGIDPERDRRRRDGQYAAAGRAGLNVARVVGLMAGLPLATGGTTVNRLCGSALQAINQASHAIMAGCEDVQIVGGLEHMQHIPMDADIDLNPKLFHRTSQGRAGDGRHGRVPGPDARHLARRARRLRPAQPSTGRRGARQRRVPPRDHSRSGVATKRAIASLVEGDQCVRPDATAESLAALKPAFMPGMGTVTAGNSSPLNDGAAALLIMSEEKAKALGLKPLVRIVATAVVGVDPAVMGTGPVPATQKALKRAGLKLADIDLIELNEAFASQALACIRMLELDQEKVNVRGGVDRHRPSAGRQRRADRHHADPQHDRSQRQPRPGHDVHRRRPGNRHDFRTSLKQGLS